MKKEEQKKIILKAIAEIFTHTPESREMIYEELEHYHDQPHRHQNTLTRAANILKKANTFSLENPAAFKAAILYRHVVFQPVRHLPQYKGISNENDSSIVCQNILDINGVHDDVINRAGQLIRFLEEDKPEVEKPQKDDAEAALFIDLDKYVLGSRMPGYKKYTQNTAQEFLSVLSEEQYKSGRAVHLGRILQKDGPVFKTSCFAKFNKAARQNMEWELNNLREVKFTSTYEVSPQLAF